RTDAGSGPATLPCISYCYGQPVYRLSFPARRSSDLASAAQTVTLDINNLDEVAPVVTSGATAAAIDENSGAGQVVYTATATDFPDLTHPRDDSTPPLTSNLVFTFAEAFSIDAGTGAV